MDFNTDYNNLVKFINIYGYKEFTEGILPHSIKLLDDEMDKMSYTDEISNCSSSAISSTILLDIYNSQVNANSPKTKPFSDGTSFIPEVPDINGYSEILDLHNDQINLNVVPELPLYADHDVNSILSEEDFRYFLDVFLENP